MSVVTRDPGDGSRTSRDLVDRLPPGQRATHHFPEVTVGTTPHTARAEWSLLVTGEIGEPRRFDWTAFSRLPSETITTDIHCARGWSKLDTVWQGVSLDVLLEGIETAERHVTGRCDGGYSTSLALDRVTDGRAWVVFEFAGKSLEPEHGGPGRLLVPHLYLWKSAKWLRRLVIHDEDRLGFWEQCGYHNHGDPWREERYADNDLDAATR